MWDLQCLSSWKTVHSQQHLEILYPYRIYSIYLVVTAFQFVLHIVAIEDLESLGHQDPTELMSWSVWARMKNLVVPSQRVSPFSREMIHTLHICLRLLRKRLNWFTEMIMRKSLNRVQICTKNVKTIYHVLCFLSWPLDHGGRNAENWTSAFSKFQEHPFFNFVPDSLWTVFTDRVPLFSHPGPMNDLNMDKCVLPAKFSGVLI